MSNTQTKKKKYKIIIKNYYKKMKFCRKFLYFFNISKYLFLRIRMQIKTVNLRSLINEKIWR